jgi:hypothetical protein
MQELMIDIDRPDFTLPEQESEISVLESLYQTPFAGRSLSPKTATAEPLAPQVTKGEIIAAFASFTVDASCQVIALAAAMPFIPRFIGKPIYAPLVRRLRS